MNKKAVAAAGGAAALAVLFGAAPASACTGVSKEKVIGPHSVLHVTANGCKTGPTLDAPFAKGGKQVWKSLGNGKWEGTVPVKAWGKQAKRAIEAKALLRCGGDHASLPIHWNPHHPGTPTPSESPTGTPTAKPTPSIPEKPESFKVTVSPKYFHAGDTLHVTAMNCPAKPSVHSQILTGGAHWTHKGTTWKTPVKVAKGLREGYYKFTVACKGFSPVVFKVKYGNPSTGNEHHPAKHNPGGQTKDIPGGAPETGGGSTARAFV